MVRVSEKVLVQCKKELLSAAKNWTVGVCKGAIWLLDGAQGINTHSACHAWVTQAFRSYAWQAGKGNYTWDDRRLNYHYHATPYSKTAQHFIVGTCHSKERSKDVCSAEAHEAAIMWIASDDFPLSKFVLNRDDKESLANAGALLLCGPEGLSEPQCMWICKFLRYGVEGSKALDVWKELVDAGVNPLLAVLVCTHVRTLKGATFGYTGMEGHSSVFRQKTNDMFVNPADLLRGQLNEDAGETTAVWATNPLKKEPSLPFANWCKAKKVDDGWGGTTTVKGANREEFVNSVLAWQEELRKDLKEGEAWVPIGTTPTKDTVFLELDM